MEYEVIHFFTDLQDSGHPYNPGDKFPRDGVTVNENRMRELSGSGNRQRKPLIKKIDTKEGRSEENSEPHNKQQNPFSYTKTDVNRMSTSELQKLATEYGVENAKERSGGELKKMLIEMFSL